LIISPLKCSARVRARALFPEPVGPSMTMREEWAGDKTVLEVIGNRNAVSRILESGAILKGK
jgi:hypothetical protein